MQSRITIKKTLVGALVGALVCLAASPRAQAPVSTWRIGDVFVAASSEFDQDWNYIAPGHLRVLNPDGTFKSDPVLTDPAMYGNTGCQIDPTPADAGLFATSFDGLTISQFATPVPHDLRQTMDVTSLPMSPALTTGPAPKGYPTFVAEANGMGSSAAIQALIFDSAGDMFVGGHVLPNNAVDWVGHGWIMKISKAGVLLDWWLVDAGTEQNPGHDVSISSDIHGVGWLDLSNDETTVYYTSEDGWVRSFHVAGPLAGTQGPAVPVHESNTVKPIGVKVFGIKILPPGDPANGFLVATGAAVYRITQQGQILNGYYNAGVINYFAVSITPDGQSFWTSTFEGDLYKFHIPTFRGFDGNGNLVVPGSMIGPIKTNLPIGPGGAAVGGLCVKREYAAALNVCFDADVDGNAIPDAGNPTGYRTVACRLPPTPQYCIDHSGDPACATPGSPTLALADRVNRGGDTVDVQLQATDPRGLDLTWSVTGLPPGVSPLVVSPSGRITGTIQFNASGGSPFRVTVRVTNARGQFATGTFLWRVTAENSPPTLTYGGGPRTVTVGHPFAPIAMQGSDADQDTVFLTASYQRFADPGFAVPAGPKQPGLPLGMRLPRDPLGREATTFAAGYAVNLAGQPDVTTTATQYFRVTVEGCDCDAGLWDRNDPAVAALHHVSASVDITVTDGPPAGGNHAPVCSAAQPSQALWPPNHKFVDVTVNGISDPDGDGVAITILSIWQDEPTLTNGSGHTIADGRGIGTSIAGVRAERTGAKGTPGDGRVYQINFRASDGKPGGTCTGSIFVGVPHDQGKRSMPIDNGVRYNSITGAIVPAGSPY